MENNPYSSSSNSCPTATSNEASQPAERECPFAKIKATALHSVLYNRKLHYVNYPPSIHNSTLQHTAEELVEHFSRSSEDSTFASIADRFDHGLPREISLQRLESYSFELYLYLEYEGTMGRYIHKTYNNHSLRMFFHDAHSQTLAMH